MTGLLVTFAIGIAGTFLGLIIVRFTSNTRSESTIQKFAEQQRQFLNMLEEYERSKNEKQVSSQETPVHF